MFEIFAAAFLSLIAALAGVRIGVYLWHEPPEDQLTFTEVALAVGDAKESRRAEGNMTRDYIDGADAVISELLKEGYGDTPEEMETAYLAGGREVELET